MPAPIAPTRAIADPSDGPDAVALPVGTSLDDAEKALILKTLAAHGNNKTRRRRDPRHQPQDPAQQAADLRLVAASVRLRLGIEVKEAWRGQPARPASWPPRPPSISRSSAACRGPGGGRQAELIARQIYAQTGRALVRSPRSRSARGAAGGSGAARACSTRASATRPIWSTRSSPIAQAGRSSTRECEGRRDERLGAPSLDESGRSGPLRRFLALYRQGRVYETTLPLLLNGEPFGSIRLGMSTTLVRRELTARLKRSLVVAAIALPLAWLAALGLAHLILRPIRALTGEIDRMRRGEFDAGGGRVGGGDEFQELSSQLQRLGKELQADRIATLSEQRPAPARGRSARGRRDLPQPRAPRPVLQQGGRGRDRTPRATTRSDFVSRNCCRRRIRSPRWSPWSWHPTGPRGMPRWRSARMGGRKSSLSRLSRCVTRARVMGTVVLLKDLESVKTVQSLVSYSAKLAALGRLTSGVAHEVKNPLNAMMIHVELLQGAARGPGRRRAAKPRDHRQRDPSAGSRRAGVPQVHAPAGAHAQAGGSERDAPERLRAAGGGEAEPGGVRFVLDLDADLPAVSADEELLRQAFINILQNACRRCRPAGR